MTNAKAYLLTDEQRYWAKASRRSNLHSDEETVLLTALSTPVPTAQELYAEVIRRTNADAQRDPDKRYERLSMRAAKHLLDVATEWKLDELGLTTPEAKGKGE